MSVPTTPHAGADRHPADHHRAEPDRAEHDRAVRSGDEGTSGSGHLPALRWRGRRFDTRRPAVAASLLGGTESELIEEARELLDSGADVAEWRVDHALAHGASPADLLGWAPRLREALGDRPLLLTLRTAPEGGAVSLSDRAYVEAIGTLIEAAGIDAIDVEFERDGALATLLPRARARGVDVLASWHDTAGTPAEPQLVARLAAMTATGADVVKVATTAHSHRDALAVLGASATSAAQLDVPLVVIAMGELGRVTRLLGHDFGSVLTFGSLARASAPGQIPVADLREVVRVGRD